MKKRSFLIIFFATLFVCSLSLFAGCVATNKLQTPKLFDPDDDNVLAWTEIDYCRGYKVRIEAENGEIKEYLTEKASYSLDNLEEGNYYISVCAVGNKRDKADSDWSEKCDFHKEYSTGLIYRLIENDTAYAVTGVGKAIGSVTIEDYYRNKPVLMIGERAFKDSRNVTSLKVGSNVTVIDEGAFYGCVSLESIELPEDLLYIGPSAFQSCTALTSITIPSGVGTIENYTFAYCRALEKAEFLTRETVLLGGEKVIDGVTTIGEGAFTACSSLAEVILPQTLTGIGASAFSSLACLAEIEFPDSLEYINGSAFSGDTLLKSVVFGKESKLSFLGKSAFFECTALEKVELPDALTEISEYTFYGCTKLDDITIPESVSEIGRGAFTGTKEYTDQTSDDANQFIFVDGWLVEYRGTGSSFVFNADWIKRNGQAPERIIGVAAYCFRGRSVTKITLPSSVKYLSSYAFASCESLTSFETEERKAGGADSELKIIGADCFYGCVKLAEIYLPSALEEIRSYAFYGCEKLQLLNTSSNANQIPQSVTRIGTRAFRNTAMWKAASPDNTGSDGILRLPVIKSKPEDTTKYWMVDYNNTKSDGSSSLYSVPSIDFTNVLHVADYAFAQLESLTSVSGSANLLSVGTGAFYKCISLRSFEFSRDFKTIKPYTFYGCTSLTGVSFLSEFDFGLSSIGAYAFCDCESLTSFNLAGSAVDSIAPSAFAYCIRLRSFTFENDDYSSEVKTIGSMAFYANFSLTSISVPDTVTAIGSRAFFQCDSLGKVEFGSGLKYIYDSAFYGCDDIRSVVLPSSLLYLGNSAFYKCPSLSDVTFKTETEEVDGETVVNGVNYIGNYAFFNAERLDFVEVPSSVTHVGKYAFRGVFGAGSVTLGKNLESLGAHAFYALDNLTVYTELTEKPVSWSGKWNSMQRPVVWGVKLGYDEKTGSYVESLTVNENTFDYTDYRAISAPRRAGMYFRRWETENGEKTYSESEVVNAPIGTVLYAVWEEVDEWIIEKDGEGRIVYIVVGSPDKMPDELKIAAKAGDSSSSTGDVFDSVDINYLTLYGWSYKRGGYAEFLLTRRFSDERIAALRPGTKLYASYYTLAQVFTAITEYDNRTDTKYDANSISGNLFG